jgi:molybdopterin synthase sulfur carrier subunit
MARVLLFGRLADRAGWRERAFDPPPASLAELRARIAELDAELARLLEAPSVRAAVDKELVAGDCPLAAGAEVAFMPAMSGG